MPLALVCWKCESIWTALMIQYQRYIALCTQYIAASFPSKVEGQTDVLIVRLDVVLSSTTFNTNTEPEQLVGWMEWWYFNQLALFLFQLNRF